MTIRLFPIAGAFTLLLVGSVAALAYPDCPAGASFGGGGNGNATQQTWNFPSPRPFYGPSVTDTPFSAQRSQSNVTLASNGAHLGGPATPGPMQYRDSLGRTRSDAMTRPFGPNGESRVTQLARIEDPVAGYEYLVDTFHNIVYRIPFCNPTPRQNQPPDAPPPANRPSGTVTRDEDLGTQTMFGVSVSGRRTTITWAPGSYQNNDIAVTSTTETWTSKQYGEFLSKRTDPERESSTTMTTFSATEPDPKLFQVPAGYQVVDEPSPFTVTIHYGN